MNKYYQLVLAATFTALTFPVVAEPISYRFASVNYAKYSSIMNGFPADVDGYAISVDLSLDVTPYIAVTTGFSRGKADVTSAGTTSIADVETVSLGVTIHLPINDRSDLVATSSFVNGDVRVEGQFNESEDINGGLTSIGVRSRISDYVELDGFVHKNSITDNSSISLSLSAGYYVNDRLSIDLGFALDSDGDTFMLGTTKYF
jgi:hypothetical protein